MVSLWSIAISIGLAIGVTALLSVLVPGVATYVSTFISSVISIFRTALSFVADNLPKPLKVLLFFVLFISIGGLIYTFTVGMTHICYNGDVYDVPMHVGISLQSWVDLEGEVKDVETLDITVSNVYENDTNVYYIGEYGNPVTSVIDGSLTQYVAFWGLSDMNDVHVVEDLDELVRTRPKEQFSKLMFGIKILGVDQFINYNICYNEDDHSCILVRQQGANSECQFGAIGRITGDWDSYVGTIRYRYYVSDNKDENDELRIVHEPDPIPLPNVPFISNYFKNGPWYDDLNDCGETAGELDGFDSETLSFTYDGLFGSDKYTAKLYNADYRPLFVTTEDAGSIEAGRLFFKVQPESFRNELDDFDTYAVKVNQTNSDLIQYQCDATEENRFKTKMTVAGLDPFAVETVVLVMILGSLVTFIGWLIKVL